MKNELMMIENELVPVYETSTGEKVVYGSELHVALGAPSVYREWVKRRLADIDAIENDDFEGVEIPTPSGQTRKDHLIKLDTAKEMAMLERNEKGKQVRRYFIQIEKKYKESDIDRQQLSPQMRMLMNMVEAQARNELNLKRQSEKIDHIADDVKRLEAKMTTHNEDYYTIARYASLRGINVDISKANMLGRKASKLSRDFGYDIGKTQDPRFGSVNTYHVDILKDVFMKRL